MRKRDTHVKPLVLRADRRLTVDHVVAVGNGRAVRVADESWARVERAHSILVASRDSGQVYGANTGVGANRGVPVEPQTGSSHALRLWRSHCAGVGPIESAHVVRAALTIRLNQILAGGSGVSVGFAKGLLRALEIGAVPVIHRLGSIGTGDLAQLAEVALTLVGERPWAAGFLEPIAPADTDALPFMSSSAFTIATAATAAARVTTLLGVAERVAAMTLLALNGSPQAWEPAVHRARPHPEQAAIASRLYTLVTSPTQPARVPSRIQDPYGLRAVPQVHAPALQNLSALRMAIDVEMNSAVENPFVDDLTVMHHGQFHLATLANLLDHVRSSLVPVLTLSLSRLSMLTDPAMTGQRPFLADDIGGSSGIMIAEYVAADALATARVLSQPVTGGSLSISLGREEHASFAVHGARQLSDMLEAAQTIVAVEAVAAVRALRLDPGRLRDEPVHETYEALAAALSDDIADRPLGADIAAAEACLTPSAVTRSAFHQVVC
jgi:histidine ammonia-lyase